MNILQQLKNCKSTQSILKYTLKVKFNMTNNIKVEQEEVSTYFNLQMMNDNASSSTSTSSNNSGSSDESSFKYIPTVWYRSAKVNGISIRREVAAVNEELDLFVKESMDLYKSENDYEVDSDSEDDDGSITIGTTDSEYSSASSSDERERSFFLDSDDESVITEESEVPHYVKVEDENDGRAEGQFFRYGMSL